MDERKMSSGYPLYHIQSVSLRAFDWDSECSGFLDYNIVVFKGVYIFIIF